MRYRILSFCMALLLITPAVFQSAGIANAVTDSADSETVRLLEALGLMEIDSETGFFWDEMPVKRSEIAKIICKMLGLEEIKNDAAYFDDVSDADRAYVETAVRYGYMSGYGYGKFGPEDYVTNTQLVKIFVTLLGGKTFAEDAGGFPKGYVTVGRRFKIIGGSFDASDSFARRADVANIIYTSLHSDIYEEVGIKGDNVHYKATEGYTFLTERRNIYRVSGIVKANEATTLNRADGGLGDSLVQIGEIVHRDSKQLTDEYLGCDVESYVHIPDGETYGEIIYVQPSRENRIINITDEDIVDVNGNTVRYYDSKGKLNSINISIIFDMIYNGKATDHKATQKLDRLTALDAADIKFVDNNGDGSYEAVIVREYIGRVVYLVNPEEEKISFKYDEQSLQLKDNYYRIFRDGQSANLNDIQTGDVALLAVSENTDGKKVIRCEISSQRLQGVVSAVNIGGDGKRYVTIAEEKYMLSSYCESLENRNKTEVIKPNVSGMFYLDARGNIASVDSGTDDMLTAYMIDYTIKQESPFTYTLSVKLFDENNSIRIFTAGRKLTVDNEKKDIEEIYNDSSVRALFEAAQLVRYSEKDGVLTEIDFPKEGYDEQEFSIDEKDISFECNHKQTINDKYSVVQDAKIFYIPNLKKGNARFEEVMNDRGYMFVMPSTFMSAGSSHKGSLYDIAEDGSVKYILIRYSVDFLVATAGDVMAVSEVIDSIDEEGNQTYEIKGFNTKGTETTIKLVNEDILNAEVMKPQDTGIKNFNRADNRPVRSGDIIQYHWGNAGKVDDICIQHAADDKEYYAPINIGRDENEEKYRCIFGKVKYTSASSIIVSGEPDKFTGPTSSGNKYIGNTGSAVYQWSKERGKFFKINFEDIEKDSDVFAFADANNITRILVMYK